MYTRNTEINKSSLPSIKYARSKHHYTKNVKTTANAGMLCPFYCNELVQPGDTFIINMAVLARMATPYQPVMDNCYIDTYLFAIQWLDIWTHTKAFWGENPNGSWVNTTEYVTPRIRFGSISSAAIVNKNALISYLGMNRKLAPNSPYIVGGGLSINAYCLTYNEWFRDQNYIAPLTINTEGSDINYSLSDVTKGGTVCNVAKFHDRFTSGLPEPQHGDGIGIPLGTEAPVYGDGTAFQVNIQGTSSSNLYSLGNINHSSDTTTGLSFGPAGRTIGSADMGYLGRGGDGTPFGLATESSLNGASSGLYADLSAAISATLSAQRIAVALNQIEEGLGMYGSRYREIIKGMWGVDSSDTAQHIPEYLGGKRTPININQVVSTFSLESGLGDTLGSTGAFSQTFDSYNLCHKSFTEHSVLLGLFCIRTENSYGQGIPRQYLKSRKYDYYWNKLAHLSFQPVYNGEIYWQSNSEDMEPHHYLPAWDEYVREPDLLTGEFCPDDPLFLGQWTYATKMANLPPMGQEWIEQGVDEIDRTIRVQSSAAHQFWIDISLDITLISEVPHYRVPGLDKF